MQNEKRKPYEAPAIEALGDLKEITQSGSESFSDSMPFTDNTAYGPDLAS